MEVERLSTRFPPYVNDNSRCTGPDNLNSLCSRSALCFPFVLLSNSPLQEPRSVKLHAVDREVHQSCSELPSSRLHPPQLWFHLFINYGLFHKPANTSSKQAHPLSMFWQFGLSWNTIKVFEHKALKHNLHTVYMLVVVFLFFSFFSP